MRDPRKGPFIHLRDSLTRFEYRMNPQIRGRHSPETPLEGRRGHLRGWGGASHQCVKGIRTKHAGKFPLRRICIQTKTHCRSQDFNSLFRIEYLSDCLLNYSGKECSKIGGK
ncbi:hypothetical protein CDAR_176441 [Caerostris darwini]|uniref:Uncharacterized protein n=1 Tax=Caerostris darwini TaxID=1538125 RepID=A0AAV4Q9Z9_9ARAC|nr:hypothetical protein CDAR_176441 [Caerostris darwini]